MRYVSFASGAAPRHTSGSAVVALGADGPEAAPTLDGVDAAPDVVCDVDVPDAVGVMPVPVVPVAEEVSTVAVIGGGEALVPPVDWGVTPFVCAVAAPDVAAGVTAVLAAPLLPDEVGAAPSSPPPPHAHRATTVPIMSACWTVRSR